MTKKNTTETLNNATDNTEKYLGLWTQIMEEQSTRMETALAELEQRNAQAIEQAKAAMAEMANVATDAMNVSQQVSQEWLKVVRGTTRRASEMMGSVMSR